LIQVSEIHFIFINLNNFFFIFTDSVIFYEDKSKPILKLSDLLGGLTCEIQSYGPGAEIIEVVSTGPKSYCLKIDVPGKGIIESRKCKGITLKYNNREKTDFATMKSLVDGDLDSVTIQLINKIERGNDGRIFTRVSSDKKFRLVYDKRARLEDKPYETLPWGCRLDKPQVIPDPNIEIEAWTIRNHLV